MRLLAPLLMGLTLSAYASLVPSTVAWLAGQSPIDADPATLTVALVLPEGLRAQKDGARLEVTVKRFDTGEALHGIYNWPKHPPMPPILAARTGPAHGFMASGQPMS
ncbi:hypothetical protein EGN72_10300 [Pseudorhodobacter sp. E13]|uniref:hypothetical protein n=1 Tax=Pseudorhodobacter sp. E13 TaxID=2487931 RepID=UPI000F8E857D|nr:hypothetical protein [Pseudorhodobacter sp. E13]RUS60181.1 hypothetical protein EGN72_10300 [Pseudorhodobacter sp. E13]